VDTASAPVCPKCGYQRKAADTAPAWQCPSCGIAYNKFGQEPARESAAADLRVRTLSVGVRDKAGDAAIWAYMLLLFAFFGLLIYFPQFGASRWITFALAGCAFVFWLRAYRRLRTIEDVPTSTIAAAAQGYVELEGTAFAAPGDTLVGHLTRLPCVWYRFGWYESGQDKGGDMGELGVPFILRDATGDCVVDPTEAEVICDRCQTWSRERIVYQEWSIRVGDPVYAIGHFSSGGAAADRHVNMNVSYALAAQERDARGYAARYDLDRDGKVDRREAALAREAQRREILERSVRQGGVHTLGPSPDGRPFLVIGTGPRRIASRYRRLAIAHLCVFFLTLGLVAYFWL
jgi:hypothetical protein